jgi:hypothetical protein
MTDTGTPINDLGDLAEANYCKYLRTKDERDRLFESLRTVETERDTLLEACKVAINAISRAQAGQADINFVQAAITRTEAKP